MAHLDRAHSNLAFSLWLGLVAGLTSTLQEVTDFGGVNPTKVGMFVYVPANVTANPETVFAIHECNSTAQAYFASTPYAEFADTYGFIVVYPNSPNADTCWDITSPATLSHDGGGDSKGIASMVDYVISTYSVDPTRVFVTGTASGGMMTNVLCRAATAYSGAAAGCFVSTSTEFGSFCLEDGSLMDGTYWGPIARAMYPGYNGTYPAMQIWYGESNAFTEFWTIYSFESLSEWSGIFGYEATESNPEIQQFPGTRGYQKSIYGPLLQGVFAYDEVDPVPIHGDEDMAWFGIGQCGGIGWTGGTVCVAPYTCAVANPYREDGYSYYSNVLWIQL
ncbi:carbohydrate esterase family 1 and carbohydrate-binding module family 1 protein [Mycena albidolilacea]|uniref:Carbohydrate esterase family 1 and carbohydrate-binding module family 1 protein n=1 Tax=Mycena albidolilacea TaxID=1033008 RepID=A0AAD6YWH6_9AGAR|nr:carbohydrate esterase family 1 and carbohydrate-binding module family 1 protein [Mycena albidolilacea]